MYVVSRIPFYAPTPGRQAGGEVVAGRWGDERGRSSYEDASTRLGEIGAYIPYAPLVSREDGVCGWADVDIKIQGN